jgi:neutral ceramidase
LSCARPLLVLSVLCGLHPARAAQPAKVFRAGAATSNITGDLGMTIVGGILPLKTTHIHDELYARCLALDNGETRLIFVVCDSCMIPRAIFDEAKRLVCAATGIPRENMMLSATHTHSATAADNCHLTGLPDPEYQRFLTRRIADGMRRALNNLEPARIGWGVGQEPRHVFNRRWFVQEAAQVTNPVSGSKDRVRMNPTPGSKDLVRPAGPVDPDVSVLSLIAINGRPLAVLANYSLHYVGGMPAGEISADYFGAFAENLKQRLCGLTQEPGFVGIMSNGTSGDVNNINFFQPAPPLRPPYEQIQIVANDVARVTERVVRSIQYHDWAPLAVTQTELTLAVRKGTAAEVARAREVVARLKNAPAVGGRPPGLAGARDP